MATEKSSRNARAADSTVKPRYEHVVCRLRSHPLIEISSHQATFDWVFAVLSLKKPSADRIIHLLCMLVWRFDRATPKVALQDTVIKHCRICQRCTQHWFCNWCATRSTYEDAHVVSGVSRPRQVHASVSVSPQTIQGCAVHGSRRFAQLTHGHLAVAVRKRLGYDLGVA